MRGTILILSLLLIISSSFCAVPYSNLTRTNVPTSSPELGIRHGRLLRDLFAMQPAIAPVDSRNTECRKHSKMFLQALERLELWALKMHDATGKVAAGLLNGNLNQFGDFQQCLSIGDDLPQSHTEVKGKYCMARAYIEPVAPATPNMENVLDLMQSHKMVQSTAFDGVRFFPSFSAISWAFCIPSSCSHADLQRSLRYMARRYNSTAEGLRVHVQVDEDACVMRRPFAPIRKTTLLTGFLIISVIAMAVIGSIYDFKIAKVREEATGAPMEPPGVFTRLCLAFSIRRNIRDLLRTDAAYDDISCLHGIRAMFSLIIYLIHRGVFGLFIPFTNRTELAEDFEGGWTMIFRAFLNNVDTFVVLSGLLTTYYSVKKLQKGKKFSILMMYLTRYVKFTPIFLITVLMVKDMDYFISSPQMIRVAQHFVNGCKNGIWKSLIYMNNFDGMDHMCYPPSHQLVTDMQMYLAAPFIILLLFKRPKLGAFLISVVLAGLALLRYVVIQKWRLSTFIFHGITLSQMLDGADRMYLNPIHRLTPYLSGIMLGYYLRVSGHRSKLTAGQMYAGWAVSLLCGYYSFFGPSNVSLRGYQYDAHQSAMFGVLQPCLWSVSLCWAIYACYTGYGGILNKFLSWKGFIVFSKLSYAFYMVQILLIFGGIATIRQPQYYKMNSVLDLNELFVLVASSVALTLLFLLPLTHVLAIFTGADMKGSKEPTTYKPYRSFSMVESRELKAVHMNNKSNRGLRFREGFLGFLHDSESRKLS